MSNSKHVCSRRCEGLGGWVVQVICRLCRPVPCALVTPASCCLLLLSRVRPLTLPMRWRLPATHPRWSRCELVYAGSLALLH